MNNATQATIALFLFVLIALIMVSLSRSPAAALLFDTPVVVDQPVIIQGETELEVVAPAAVIEVDAATIGELDLVAHTVENGDTLWSIAQRYDTSVDAIMELNPQLTDRDLIKPGQTLVIPRQ